MIEMWMGYLYYNTNTTIIMRQYTTISLPQPILNLNPTRTTTQP